MVSRGWLPVLRETAKAVIESVEPLVGTQKANEIVYVRSSGDATRKIDAVAEQAAINVLRESGMPFVLVSEESGVSKFGEETGQTVVLDPLDGSANAIRGIPAYSMRRGSTQGQREMENQYHHRRLTDFQRA